MDVSASNTAAESHDSLHLDFCSNQTQFLDQLAAAGDRSQTQISNQLAAAGDGNQIETSNQLVAAGDGSQTETSIQAAAVDGSQTEIRYMSASLYKAAANGDINKLEGILQIEDIPLQLTHKRNTVLHIAAQFGRHAWVEQILRLSSCSTLLMQPNRKGDTPLHLAARGGRLMVVKALIHAAKLEGEMESGIGADKVMLRMTNNEGDTALHEAVRCNHSAVVELLIKEDAEFMYGDNNKEQVPLYMAAETGFGDIVQIIIDKTSTSPAYSGIKGRTALHAAVISSNQEVVKKMLEWKADLVKEVDEDGWSPLHFAAHLGYTSIARQLLEKSDDTVIYLTVRNDARKTALHIGASRGHIDIVELLVSHTPNCCEQVDDNGNNLLHLIMPQSHIISTSDLLNMEWLSVRELMREKNNKGQTPLHLLADSQMANRNPFIINDKVDKMALNHENFTATDKLSRAEDISGNKDLMLTSLRTRQPYGWTNKGGDDGKGISDYELMKISESHLVVAALIATVTFAAALSVPGGYNDKEGKYHGMAVLMSPDRYSGTKGKDHDIAMRAKSDFEMWVLLDTLAMLFSMVAVAIYFLLALFRPRRRIMLHCILYGHILTFFAMGAMVFAFLRALSAVLPDRTLLTEALIPLVVVLVLPLIYMCNIVWPIIKI